MASRISTLATPTQLAAATAQQLLVRYGVLTREAAMGENISGGFSSVYPVLKSMEESGRVRRGLFVAGLGATQFAMPAALDLVRSLRDAGDRPEVVHLAAPDPCNPYGTVLKWPSVDVGKEAGKGSDPDSGGRMLARSVGASLILVNGGLAAYLRRRNPEVLVFLPEDEPERSAVARCVAEKLADIALQLQKQKRGLLIGAVNGVAARSHFMASFLEKAGFVPTALGFQMRRVDGPRPADAAAASDRQLA